MSEKSMFDPMEGFLIIDSVSKMKDPNLIALLLHGDLDIKIKSALFFKKEHRTASSEEELHSNSFVNIGLGFIKDDVRKIIQLSINLHQEQNKKKTTKSFKDQNKVSELGTVAEICEKYNLSKSKVRELKRNNELEDYIKSL